MIQSVFKENGDAIFGQPIAYLHKISFKNFSKKKVMNEENFSDTDFEFSKFSGKKILKNNNLSVSQKTVS